MKLFSNIEKAFNNLVPVLTFKGLYENLVTQLTINIEIALY